MNEKVDFDYKYIMSCLGLDEDGDNRCEITASILEFDENSNTAAPVSIRSTANAELNVSPRGNYTSVDITWPSAYDPELTMFWNLLEDYGKKVDSVHDFDDSNEIKPLLQILIISKEMSAEGYFEFWNPEFWALIPVTPGSKDIKKIRLMVPTSTFVVTQNENAEEVKELDKKIQADAARRHNTIMTERNRHD